MTPRLAINGFGRIGRAVVRAAIERDADLDIVAVNDVFDVATLAQLLQRDSVYGRFPHLVGTDGDAIVVAGRRIAVTAAPKPEALPWEELSVDVVIEATGRFRTRAAAEGHLHAGARKVILSAPAKGADPADADVVLGVNFDTAYDPARHHIITNASCTTNCLAPVAKVLHETVGIRHGLMTTIHAYTADQNLLDGPHKDPRRARAAALNLVPTSTGAAKALGLVIPELAGRLNGFAVRVPIPTGSIVDLTIEAERPTSVEEVNGAFAAAPTPGRSPGSSSYSEEPIVSADIVGSPVLVDLRRPADRRDRRDPGQGRRLVRQRVGLREPARRARRARARPGRGRGVSMPQVRFHGRGGQGVVTSAELLSTAAFLDERHAQAFPSFGSERMGAPVVAFCRVDDRPIRSHEPIAEPDVVVIQDATLLHQVDVFGGLGPDGIVLVNTTRTPDQLGLGDLAPRLGAGAVVTVPASALAREHLGRPLPGAPLLGALAAVTGIVSAASLAAAIGERFAGETGARQPCGRRGGRARLRGGRRCLGSSRGRAPSRRPSPPAAPR